MLNKIKKILSSLNSKIPSILYIVFAVTFSIILIGTIIYNNTNLVDSKMLEIFWYDNGGVKKVNVFILFISVILYMLISFLIYKIINKKIKNKKKFIIIFWCIFIIIQFVFSYVFLVNPSWDFGGVYDAAVLDITGQLKIFENSYFYRYGNNLGCALLLKVIFTVFDFVFKLIGIKTKYLLIVGIVFNILMIDISLFFLQKFLKLIFNENLSLYFSVLTFMFSPFITYTPIFYTDTLSMPFAIISIYYFAKMVIENKFNVLNFIIIGLVIGIGTSLKFSVIIILIGIVIYLIFYKINLKDKLKYMIISLVFLILPLSILSIYQKRYMNKDLLEKNKFPVTHWIMMGLRNSESGIPGGYSLLDVEYTGSIKGLEAKKEANVKEIKLRIKDKISKKELIGYYVKKAAFVWGDGSFFAPNVLRREPINNFKIKKLLIGNEKENLLFRCYSQASMIVIQLMFISAVMFRKYLDEKQNKILFLNTICIFGVLLFFLLWEARSRYLVNFIPLILIEAFLGMTAISNKIKNSKGV